jgi:hypothetical protein
MVLSSKIPHLWSVLWNILARKFHNLAFRSTNRAFKKNSQ